MTTVAGTASTLSKDANSKRRRFQAPITSYFASAGPTATESNHNDNGASSPLSHHNYSAPTYSASPALPHKVQSSLLTVGMRVRKSVPEGYKTEVPKPSVYALAAAKDSTSGGYVASRTSYAELAPFCGIHKIGNLAVQTFPAPAAGFGAASEQVSTDEGDAFSLPSSSQDSVASSIIPPPNPHKRTYDEDFEEDDGDDLEMNASGIWNDPLASSRFNTYSTSPSLPRRTILSPNLGQQRRQFPGISKSSWGQENCDPFSASTTGGMDVDDFEEPAFLRRREEVDADYLTNGSEVEMRGV
ncbi:conserved hypothetical protein [Paecilomyces variotii No. 5]|uniref:Uncharacterized protein n=1 Tax=Byssochlamys spectabilis (strain No. 5 / NBRC 109023) TaxID=1356009 RepID=V5G0C1_BYSSN|nr:conserved hypothetical protein [Paecilomyces variotii No. 5]